MRQRAERNHRSLQGELLAIIEAAVDEEWPATPADILAEVRQSGVAHTQRGCRFDPCRSRWSLRSTTRRLSPPCYSGSRTEKRLPVGSTTRAWWLPHCCLRARQCLPDQSAAVPGRAAGTDSNLSVARPARGGGGHRGSRQRPGACCLDRLDRLRRELLWLSRQLQAELAVGSGYVRKVVTSRSGTRIGSCPRRLTFLGGGSCLPIPFKTRVSLAAIGAPIFGQSGRTVGSAEMPGLGGRGGALLITAIPLHGDYHAPACPC